MSVPAPVMGSISTEQHVTHNTGVVVGVALTQVLRGLLDHHLLPPAFVERQVKTFAVPPGYAAAEEVLSRHRILVLLGERDSGLHHAAVHLLGRIPGIRPREVLREPGSAVEPSSLPDDANVGLLIDMRQDEHINPALGRALAAAGQQLLSRGSYLVVIAYRSHWDRVAQGTEYLVHNLMPAPSAAIVRHRLTADYRNVDADLYLTDDRVLAYLAVATPAEALRWVDDIAKIASGEVDGGPPDDPGDTEMVAQRIGTLLNIRSNYRNSLLERHSNIDSRGRNFLLAAAVLEGSRAGAVFEAAGDLAVALGEEAPKAAGQQGPGLIQLTQLVDAQLIAGDHVIFRQPRYAEAVLEYFWIDRQHLRERFLTWLADLPIKERDPKVSRAMAERLAPLVLRQAISERTPALLRDVVGRWATASVLREVSAQLLLAAALDDEFGNTVRRSMLEWARQPASAETKVVLAEVCSGDLLAVRPVEALYRIGVLADSPEPQVIEAVSTAIGRLWRTHHRDTMVRLVDRWCKPDQPGPSRRAGARMFVTLCKQTDDVGALTFRNSREDQLFSGGWNAVLDTLPDAGTAALNMWLDDAVRSPERRESLGKILASAVAGSDGRAGWRAAALAKVLFARQPTIANNDLQTHDAVRDEIYSMVIDEMPTMTEGTLPPPEGHNNPEPMSVPDGSDDE